MANIYPNQVRTIDPYSSYNSNVVNKFTRLISNTTNCLHHVHAIDITIDTTSPIDSIVVHPGKAFKDDVLIEINENFTVDMTEENFYIDSSGGWWNEAGYYYIVLRYTYAKARPAPQASIQILMPSQQSRISEDQFLFLKAVKVIFNGSTFEIESVHDFDPLDTDIKRVYAQIWVGVEEYLPTFDQFNDEGRLIYVRNEDELYYGTSGRWETFSSIRVIADTTECTVGQITHLHLDGKMRPALATANDTLADGAVLQIGTVISGDGKVRLYGRVEDVPIEPGRSIEEGENVYLSASHPGTITDLMPPDFPQFIGVGVTPGSSTGSCTIWFMPGHYGGGGGGGGQENWYDIYQDMLLLSIYKRLTVDAFHNVLYTDLVNTTAHLNTSHWRMDGNSGDEFWSNNLINIDYDGTSVVTCMLSADSTGNIDFYLTNDGGNNWEQATINHIHYFADTIMSVSGVPSLPIYSIGEGVTGTISGKTGIVAGFDPSTHTVLLREVTGHQPWFVGENIIGSTSGTSRVLLSQPVGKITTTDVRVKAIYNTEGFINDYGILWEEDNRIVDTFLDNERNIDTLYADLYSVPSLDNDGIANLLVPIETCKNNLQTFVGAENDLQTIPPYTSTLIIDSTSNLTLAISQLDKEFDEFRAIAGPEAEYMRSFMGKDNPGLENPNYSSSVIITQGASLEQTIGELDHAIDVLLNDSTSELAFIREYIGKTTSGQEDPTYSSTYQITQGASLTYVIGELDTAVNDISGGASAELGYIRDFIGKNSSGIENPTYLSTNIITQNSNLEAAISALDSRFQSTNLDLTIPNGSATPSVLSSGKQVGILVTANTSATTITNFLNGITGSEITIIFKDNNTTIQHNSIIRLSGGLDFIGSTNDTLTLVYNQSLWLEKSRSLNA